MAKAKKFTKGNPFATAMRLTKGKSCDRPAVLKAVKAGSSPREAVAAHCGGASSSMQGLSDGAAETIARKELNRFNTTGYAVVGKSGRRWYVTVNMNGHPNNGTRMFKTKREALRAYNFVH